MRSLVHESGGLVVGTLAEEHGEEVRCVGEGGVGGDGGLAAADAVVRGDDGGGLGGDPQALPECRLVGDVVDLGVERCQGGDAGAEHVHRVSILHPLDDLQHLLRHCPVTAEGRVEFIQFSAGGEALHEHEVHDFLEARVLGQVVDLVAPVDEASHVADDQAGLSGLEVDVPEPALKLDLLLGHAPSSRINQPLLHRGMRSGAARTRNTRNLSRRERAYRRPLSGVNAKRGILHGPGDAGFRLPETTYTAESSTPLLRIGGNACPAWTPSPHRAD